MDKESWRSGGDSQPAPRGESSFDELAKNLADGSISRRKALRSIGGAFVGGLLASIPGTAWAAKSPPPGKGGCPPGRTQCRGKCVNLQSDRNNCGQCSNVCSDEEQCLAGTCCNFQKTCGSRCCGPNEFCAGQDLCRTIGQCDVSGQCGVNFPFCAPNCICLGSVEGPVRCGESTFCGAFCTSSAECEANFGPGYFCQASGTGCCGQSCVPPCAAAGTTTLGTSSTGKLNVG